MSVCAYKMIHSDVTSCAYETYKHWQYWQKIKRTCIRIKFKDEVGMTGSKSTQTRFVVEIITYIHTYIHPTYLCLIFERLWFNKKNLRYLVNSVSTPPAHVYRTWFQTDHDLAALKPWVEIDAHLKTHPSVIHCTDCIIGAHGAVKWS